MAGGGEGVGDGAMEDEEALRRSWRSKALHLPPPPADRHMRAFRAVVLALPLDVLGRETELTGRRAVRRQARSLGYVLQEAPPAPA